MKHLPLTPREEIKPEVEAKPTVNVVQYVVLRAKQTQPEILIASSDEEAWETVDKQVRMGKTPVVYLFKLLGASCYQPSSVHLSPLEILDGGVKARTLNLETSSNDN